LQQLPVLPGLSLGITKFRATTTPGFITTATLGIGFHNKPIKRACEYKSADENQANQQLTYDIRD